MACKNCVALQKEVNYLRGQLKTKQNKIHFDLDGMQTACGLDVYEIDASDNIEDVNCKTCLRKWDSMKKSWEKEKREDENK